MKFIAAFVAHCLLAVRGTHDGVGLPKAATGAFWALFAAWLATDIATEIIMRGDWIRSAILAGIIIIWVWVSRGEKTLHSKIVTVFSLAMCVSSAIRVVETVAISVLAIDPRYAQIGISIWAVWLMVTYIKRFR